MKNYLMFALILCAIPAVAVGQTVSCDGCSHSVSVYMGEGGLIASTDADEVTYVASCNGVTRSGELMPNDDGVVAMLLAGDLACHGDDDASFELGPINDGGWYWITMESNSAVGGLVSNDILDNDTVDIADAGAGVTMVAGAGAVLLTETATGRTGLLPNILPVPPADPVTVCGHTGGDTPARRTTNCMLGDGKAVIRALGPAGTYSGERDQIPNMGMVTRPASGSVEISFDLWGNGTGHYTSATDGDATLGHGPDGTPLDATITGTYSTAQPGGTPPGIDGAGGASDTAAGLALRADADNDDIAHLTITPNATYCGEDANHSVAVTLSADAGTPNEVVPPIAENDAGTVAATLTLTVVCPAAAAQHQGIELVPENPFPTDR